jgi:hypothetical protein
MRSIIRAGEAKGPCVELGHGSVRGRGGSHGMSIFADVVRRPIECRAKRRTLIAQVA